MMQEQNHFFESEDHTMEFDTQDIQDAKIWSVLAYTGILFFLPLLAAPNSAYGKFHANQGFILLIFQVVLTVASWLVDTRNWGNNTFALAVNLAMDAVTEVQ